MKHFYIAAISLAALFTSGCSSVTPEPGHVAVLVTKPLIFGHGGVEKETVSTGRAYVAWTTSVIPVNINPTVIHEKFDDIASKDGIKMDFNTQLQIQVTNPPELIEKFGEHWYERNLQPQFRMEVQQICKTYTMQQLAFEPEVLEQADKELQRRIFAYVASVKIPIKASNITMGNAIPPNEILAQRAQTAEQIQRVQTEIRKGEADQAEAVAQGLARVSQATANAKSEEARAIAEAKRAVADQAYLKGLGLTAGQFVELKRIEAIREACANNKCIFGNLPVLMTDKGGQ
jgi:regulator of protease activity HflC (stomatin/prohibitin superfamily)